MSTIDERTVALNFKNSTFEKDVGESMSTLSKLKAALRFPNADKGFKDISKSADNVDLTGMGRAIDTVTSRMSTMGIIGMSVIQNLTNSIVNFTKRTLGAIVAAPVTGGFKEYEVQMNAIQTILANTESKGTVLADVSEALDELNTYADRTIYNFTQMTRNIGTFTAAGVDLDVATAAIKGIANLAAVSGSNSQQASTAMYQLSQAMASGTVKLMDWNSVVNAGMGGQVFKDALADTARVHGVAIDSFIEQDGSFRSTLQRGWLSSEILTDTLAKFTGDLTEQQLLAMGYQQDQIEGVLRLGEMANDAATKVKTFSQLKDTLDEALGSGWSQSFQLLFGDFEAAKTFFTAISDKIGEIIQHSSDSRNALLQDWKDAGGRMAIIAGITNSITALHNISVAIGEAISEIFPPKTGEQLAMFSNVLAQLAHKFKMASENSEPLQRIVKGLASAVHIAVLAVEAIAIAFGRWLEPLSGAPDQLLEYVLVVADFVTGVRDAIIEGNLFNDWIRRMERRVRETVAAILSWIEAVKDMDIVKNLGGLIDDLGLGRLSDYLSDLKGDFSFINSVGKGFVAIMTSVLNVGKAVAPILLDVANNGVTALRGIVRGMWDAFGEIDYSKVFKTVNTGLITAILLGIRNAIANTGDILENVADIFEGVGDSLQAWQLSLKADVLLKIAAAIGIIALSIIAISSIDGTKLKTALAAMTVMFVELFGAAGVLTKITSGAGLKTALLAPILLIGISASLLILSGAIANLARLSTEDITRGLTALVAALAGITIAVNFLPKNLVAKGVGLIAVSIAIRILAEALQAFGELTDARVNRSLVAMGASLLILAIGLRAMQGTTLGAIALGIASVALIVLGLALKTLGSMSAEEVRVALIGMAAGLAVLALGLTAMSGTLLGSAALLIASLALNALAFAMVAISKLSWDDMLKSLAALAAVFVVIGLAALVLTPVLPSILALGVAMVSIGVGALALGAGIFLLSLGLTAIGASASIIAAGIGLIGGAILLLIPGIVLALGILITGLLSIIVDASPLLLEAAIALFTTIIGAIVFVIPALVDGMMILINALLDTLVENISGFVDAGWAFLLAILTGIRDNITETVNLGAEIVVRFMDGLASKIPELIVSAHNLMISFIDGLADSVEENLPKLQDAMGRLATAVLDGFVNGITSGAGVAWQAISDMGEGVLSAFKDVLGIHSPSAEMEAMAIFIKQGIVNGLVGDTGAIYQAMSQLGELMLTTLEPFLPKFYAVGVTYAVAISDGFTSTRPTAILAVSAFVVAMVAELNINRPLYYNGGMLSGAAVIDGFIYGIETNTSLAAQVMRDLAYRLLSEFEDALGISSPSEEFRIRAGYILAGIVDGLSNRTAVVNGVRRLTSAMMSAFSDGVDLNMDLTPTITPVLDLSKITGDVTRLSNMLVSPVTVTSPTSLDREVVTRAATTDTKQSDTVTFTQNNYSPKALNRIDIYRRTKGQVATYLRMVEK